MGIFDIFKKKEPLSPSAPKKSKLTKRRVLTMSEQELLDAIDSIDDQELLTEIVNRPYENEAASAKIILKAVRKINDQEVLKNLVLTLKKPYIVRKIIHSGKLTDQTLADIMDYLLGDGIRLEAARMLNDPYTIKKILIRQLPGMEKIPDQEKIVTVLVEKMQNRGLLKDVVKYANSRWVASVVQKKLDQMNKPSKKKERTFKPYTGSGNCDVCGRSLSGVNAWIVPNDVFYSSRQYREVMKMALMMAGKQGTEAEIDRMQAMDHSAGSAVCESCVSMFDGKPESSASASAPASDETDNLLIYMDIDKLGDGAYGLASGRVVAKAVPASMMEGITIFDGDSKATLYGSANECVVGLRGSSSALDAIEQKLRDNPELTGVLSATGIRRGGMDEPLVVNGPVHNGVIVIPPGKSTSLCAAGFNNTWK